MPLIIALFKMPRTNSSFPKETKRARGPRVPPGRTSAQNVVSLWVSAHGPCCPHGAVSQPQQLRSNPLALRSLQETKEKSIAQRKAGAHGNPTEGAALATGEGCCCLTVLGKNGAFLTISCSQMLASHCFPLG